MLTCQIKFIIIIIIIATSALCVPIVHFVCHIGNFH